MTLYSTTLLACIALAGAATPYPLPTREQLAAHKAEAIRVSRLPKAQRKAEILRARAATLRPRIVGGTELAPPRSHHFLTSVQDDTGWHFCGGILIAERWVLSAAHCFERGLEKQVQLGVHSQAEKGSAEASFVRTAQIKRTINHADYDSGTVEHDIALLELQTAITDYAPIDQIDTPNGFTSKAGEMMSVSGWGSLSAGGLYPDKAQTVDVPMVLNDVCNSLPAYSGDITPGMLCAGATGYDSCQGDSGGPFFKKTTGGGFVLGGVVSWGVGCGDAGAPGVYTRASYYKDWICTKTNNEAKFCGPSPPSPPAPPPSPPSPPAPPSPPPGLCVNSCPYANDQDCDDGGADSDFSVCDYGTDCNDCGTRPVDDVASPPPSPVYHPPSISPPDATYPPSSSPTYPAAPPSSTPSPDGALCSNTCQFKNDDDCDDGGEGSAYNLCPLGTDCNDCGPRGGTVGTPVAPPSPSWVASPSPNPPPSPSPWVASPSPNPPPSPSPSDDFPIPAGGVQVMMGSSERMAFCLKPGMEHVKRISDVPGLAFPLSRPVIAAQCCTASNVCRRSHQGTCIAGFSGRSHQGGFTNDPWIQTHTYSEAKAKCAAKGLVMCQQSCRNTGCWYNMHPVYTDKPCPAEPPSAPSAPPLALSPPQPSPPPPAIQHSPWYQSGVSLSKGNAEGEEAFLQRCLALCESKGDMCVGFVDSPTCSTGRCCKLHEAWTPFFSPSTGTFVKRGDYLTQATRAASSAATANPDWSYADGEGEEAGQQQAGDVKEPAVPQGRSAAAPLGVGALVGLAVALLVSGVLVGAALTLGIQHCRKTRGKATGDMYGATAEKSEMSSVSALP